MEIAIEHLCEPTAESAALIAELDTVLGAVYAPHRRHGLSLDEVFQPNVGFFIARIADAAVGCGAVALFDDYAEVKRMYTRVAARRRGVGKALLARIESEARHYAALPPSTSPRACSTRSRCSSMTGYRSTVLINCHPGAGRDPPGSRTNR
jgi:GNAT superfamily N-acetyltransferase